MAIKTRAIILKSVDQGEADKVFTVLTRDFGKLNLIGKAVRKMASKLRFGLSRFALLYIEFVPGKINPIIIETAVLKDFSGIKTDFKKMQVGFYICRLLDKFLKENDKDENIWNLAAWAFSKLNNLESSPKILGKFLRYFELRLVKFLGHMPELYYCVGCGNKIKEEHNLFCMASGGLICLNCQKEQKILNLKGIKINSQTIKISRVFFEKNLDFLKRLKMEEKNLKNLKQVSADILSYIAEENSFLEDFSRMV